MLMIVLAVVPGLVDVFGEVAHWDLAEWPYSLTVGQFHDGWLDVVVGVAPVLVDGAWVGVDPFRQVLVEAVLQRARPC
jgi:hypothetical protein